MKIFQFSLIVCVIRICASFNQVPCEYIAKREWISFGTQKTCFMHHRTLISSEEFTISSAREETVLGLLFELNKKIFHLPEKIHEKLPNLIGLDAGSCSIRSISKRNFKNLFRLNHLWLENNQIVQIESDTFEDLKALEVVVLRDNKIKFMSGKVFESLENLLRVYLRNNECVDQTFGQHHGIIDTEYQPMAALTTVLTENCGYEEEDNENTDERLMLMELQLNLTVLEKKISDLESNQTALEVMLEKYSEDINIKDVTIARLQSELQESERKKTDSESQFKFIRMICERLEAARNESFIEKTEALRNSLAIATLENEKLVTELYKKIVELNKKDSEIKNLTGKN